MTAFGIDTLKTRHTLTAAGKSYDYYSLEAAGKAGLGDISELPFSLKVLLENLLRWEDGRTVTVDDIKGMAGWLQNRCSDREIAFRPARVLMQDFTGVPAVVDLAAMRDAMVSMGGDPQKINPLSPVDLVIDHSVMIDFLEPMAQKRKMKLWNSSVTRNAMSSFAGARPPSITSALSRPEQAFAIKSMWSTLPGLSGQVVTITM